MPVSALGLPCTLCMEPAYYVCSLCRVTRYCSESCSSRHWPAHKHACVLTFPPGICLPHDDGPTGLTNGFAANSVTPPARVSAAGLSPTQAARMGPSQTRPSPTQVAGTGPSLTGPSPTQAPRTGPSPTQALRTGPSQTGPSQTGPSQTGPSQTGLSPTQAPQTRPSSTQAPQRGASQTRTLSKENVAVEDLGQGWAQPEELSDKEFTKVLVTVSQSGKLWVNVHRNETKVVHLHQALADAAASSAFGTCVPRVGQVLAGCYQHQWCRVKVLSVRPELVVRYIDFGNEETIAMRDLGVLPAELRHLPAQAIRIRFRQDEQHKVDQHKVDSIMFVKLVEKAADGSMFVEVEGEEVIPPPPTIPTQELPADTWTKVSVLEPGKTGYWVNVAANGGALVNLLKRMTIAVGAHTTPVTPIVNGLVAAEFTDDSGTGWYRAKVLGLAPLKVLFLDFGNVDIVKPERLRPLPVEFHALPAQAIKVELKPGTPAHFCNLPSNTTLQIWPVGKGPGYVVVEVEESSTEKTEKPIPAVASADAAFTCVALPTDQLTPVTVAAVDEEGCLVTLDANAELSYNMVIELNARAQSLPACDQMDIGSAVAALFAGEWYRGEVVALDPLKVFYIDYGNTELVQLTDVKQLPAEFFKQPAQAVKISLPASTPTPAVNAQLRVRSLGRTAGKATLVELEAPKPVGPKPVQAAAVPGDQDVPSLRCLKTVEPPLGKPTEVYFACQAGGDRYVQLMSASKQLLALGAEITAFADQLKGCRPKTGAAVLVFYESEWARAEVLTSGPEVQVHFIDFGNVTTVPEATVFEMPSQLSVLPAQGLKIFLSSDTQPAVHQLEDFAPFMATFLSKAQDATWTIRGETK